MTQANRAPANIAPHSLAGQRSHQRRFRLPKNLALVFALITALLIPQSSAAIADEIPDAAADAITQIVELTRAASTAATEKVEQTQSPQITLAAANGAFVEAGSNTELNITITNPAAEFLEGTRVDVRLANQPLQTLGEFRNWISPDSIQSLNTQNSVFLGQFTSPIIEPGSSFETTLTLTSARIASMAPGVYAIEAISSTSALSGHGTITIKPNSASSMNITVVVPITAPPQSSGLLGYTRLNELTAPGGELKIALDAVRGTNAVIALDPAIPAAIRVLGADAPTNATTWLTQLESMPNERFPLQFGDADVSAQFQAGLQHPLSVDSLLVYETSSAQNEPLSIAQLTSIANPAAPANTLSTPIYLPYQAGMSDEVYSALASSRTNGNAPVTLLGSSALTVPAPQAMVTAAQANFVVYDEPLSQLLQQSFAADTESALSFRLSTLAAEISLRADKAPKSLVLLTDRGAALNQASVRTTLLTLARLSPGTLAPLSTILSEEPEAVVPTTYPAQQSRADFVAEQLALEPVIADFATVIEEPEFITGANRAEFLQLLAVGWTAPLIKPSWQEASSVYETKVATLLSSVELLPPVHSALLSSEATLQYWVRNDLPYEVNLVLEANPENSRLAVTQFTKFSAAPRSKSAVVIPVNTRLSSGETDVSLILRSEANVQIGPNRIGSVYVQAEEDGIISLILIGISTVLIALGLWRTIKRRRKVRAESANLSSNLKTPNTFQKPDSGASE